MKQRLLVIELIKRARLFSNTNGLFQPTSIFANEVLDL